MKIRIIAIAAIAAALFVSATAGAAPAPVDFGRAAQQTIYAASDAAAAKLQRRIPLSAWRVYCNRAGAGWWYCHGDSGRWNTRVSARVGGTYAHPIVDVILTRGN
jgi:hypothetical protein